MKLCSLACKWQNYQPTLGGFTFTIHPIHSKLHSKHTVVVSFITLPKMYIYIQRSQFLVGK